MKNIVYHGSSYGDIEELVAKKSTHQIKCIYATEERAVSLLFMGNGKGDLDHSISSENGQLTFVERREGVIASEFQNVGGYLYELDGTTFNHYDFLWDKEVISYETSIKPLSKTFIPDIYAEILKEEEKGNIKIYRYPNRPERIPLDNSDLVEKYIKHEKDGLTGSIKKLLSVYPEFASLVEEKLNSENNEIKSQNYSKSL